MTPMETIQGRLSIFVNGRARQVGATTTLGELAAECRLDPKWLLVELNGQTLLRDQLAGAAARPTATGSNLSASWPGARVYLKNFRRSRVRSGIVAWARAVMG